MPVLQDQVLGLWEQNKVNVLVYPTRPKQPDMIDSNTTNIVDRVNAPSFTRIANATQFPDVIVLAGITKKTCQ